MNLAMRKEKIRLLLRKIKICQVKKQIKTFRALKPKH